jgi:hypothetical protein
MFREHRPYRGLKRYASAGQSQTQEKTMPRLLPGLVATTILAISSVAAKLGRATVPGVGSLSPVTKSYVPIEKVGYWRRQYRRAYRRGYYAYGYPYYGYGYYQPYGYYRPYPYYGYGSYRPYPYYGYGYGWRY